MTELPNMFGHMVFNDSCMKERLPEEVYHSLKQTMASGKALDKKIADVVANAMKDWAVEKGATHYTHWFQPMTGVTAEKHDSFITPVGGGNVIMEFSGKELVKGEPDASSFPSGGLRATFEARGYTAWDPTSYAFIKGNTLCIPTAFCSYSGEALDRKTPLLRSMQAINRQAKRILKLFGREVDAVVTTVGPEQEYFLIDKAMYEARPDLIYCGRTLIGARPPKGQEMDDHYFGTLKPRVAAFMVDLDKELWKLGVLAKTEHNEAAPAQHELAPIFATANIATDHNQLTMETMKRIADKHGMACLLHEKPFAGVNGSGKHDNWALSTSDGENLFNPGATPSQNARFLLFLAAVMKAVDEHQDLLRICATGAGNDHRLGASEAPPAIVSMYLGDDLEEIIEDLLQGAEHEDRKKEKMKIGVSVLPGIPKDTTDRNRTSPFAFTGNKFEFRMLGSSASVAPANTFLNTIVADVLDEFADKLEKSDDFSRDLNRLIRHTIRDHKRIIFNGNNYSDEWVEEAERRGLLNLKTTVDAVELFPSEKNIALFEKHGVYTEAEIRSRYEIMLENYSKTLHIEVLTMLDMVKMNVVPSVIAYEKELADTIAAKEAVGVRGALEVNLLNRIAERADVMYKKLCDLEEKSAAADREMTALDTARFYRDSVCPAMEELRTVVDELEMLVASKYWAYPTYAEMLYSIK